MKINKLFAILFAVLGVNTLSAQTDVTSTYLTNPSFELGTSGSAAMTSKGFNTPFGWTSVGMPTSGTHNFDILAENATSDNSASGFGITVKPADGSYYYLGRHSWQSALTVTLSQETTSALPEGKYLIDVAYKLAAKNNNVGGHLTLTASQGGTSLATTSSSTSASQGTSFFNTAGWNRLAVPFTVTTDGIVKIELGMVYNPQAAVNTVQEAIIIDDVRLYNLENASSTNPIDVTGLLVNPSFELNTFNGTLDAGSSKGDGNYNYPTGWTFLINTAWTNCVQVTAAPSDGSYAHEVWSGTVNSIDIHQTVTLPAGKYTISADLRTDNVNYITNQGVYASIGGIVTKSGTITNVASTWNSLEGWNNLSATFNNGSEGEVILGISSTGTSGSAGWFQMDNVRLMYLGYDLTAANEQLNTLIATAQGIVTANAAAPKTIENLNTAITAAQNAEQTKDALETASANLTTAINAANATVDVYANFKDFLATCNAILTNSEEFEDGAKTTFTNAINAAQTNVESATTADAINAEYTTLETARQTYIQKADPINDTYFDYTFKITNAAVANGNGWTNARTASGEQYTDAPDGTYLDSWNGAGQNIYQEVANLPSGLYTLKAAGRASTSCTSAYIYLNDTKAEIEKAGNTGNDLGRGWKWYTTEKTAVAGIATIGFGCNTASSQWAGADDFHLYYHGFDAATAQNSVTTLKAEAEALVGKVMNANVATNLDNAISGADATKTTRNELNAMIEDLNTAIADAKTSIADYEIIPTYIAKANKIDESIAADYQTAYDNRTISESAETVFQNLEVATYNYVIGEFTYNVELEAGGWVSEGPVGSKSDQHYSGNSSSYMEQSSEAWGSSSWNISYKYEKTLPAGKYIFKVAGRRAQGTGNTMSLNVTNITDSENPVELGSVNDFPEGDAGLGINKAGAASFNAEDEAGFANNNAGRGWQWRYVMFELDAETTVEVAVNAAATTNHQWISFCDATLQMTEETYLNANQGALDAPTAAAEALVDTKPMGDAENTALKDALAMPVTTGAELQAKIDALNVAVTNANAWVAAYNEAQAPLVAALERFETDYNNGEEGAIDYMAQSRWAAVIEMVEAAALAKDVTNSYEGFAAATTNLVDALDAADVSIAEYKALKEAIDNANAAAAVNWSDQPFQRPEEDKEDLTNAINAAQAVYTAATAEGEGVTSQTTALNDALDVVNNLELNAPAEGAVYNIIVATAGHALEGAPVVATLGATGDNNPTGYGFAAKEAYTDGPANMLYTFTKVKDNNYHISVKVKGETVYLTYGSLNGSAAGWKESQIQGTTNIETAGEFEIVASNTTEGVIKIRNTVTNDFIDSQDGGNIYTDTGIENEDFKLTLVEELSAEISIDAADKFATCVLMFDADLANTEGLKVYVPESYTTQDGLNYFIFRPFEEAVLPAYTPCILYAANGFEGTLTGTVQMEDYDDQVVKGSGYLYGALESQDITEGYVMVKLNGEDEVTFRNVSKSGRDYITIPAGKCWLDVPTVQATVASFTCLFRGGEASNIDEVLLDKISVKDGAIYTLDGKRVNDIERGKIYIINGKKAIVK